MALTGKVVLVLRIPIALTVAVGFAQGACTVDGPQNGPGLVEACQTPSPLTLTRIAELEAPVSVASTPADPRLYIVQKTGQIWARSANGELDVFLDMRSSVAPDENGGLFNLAFAIDYASSGRFFVFYTRRVDDPFTQDLALGHGDIVIAEGSRDQALPLRAESRLRPIATVDLAADTQHGNHNGGALVVGPDGYLYATIGDCGPGNLRGDPLGSGQDTSSLCGKVIRIDTNDVTRRVPGNYDAPAHRWVFAAGVRNPWRMTFDRSTNDLLIADVGETMREEIDVIVWGATKQNFGWNAMEGTVCRDLAQCANDAFTPPAFEYGRDEGQSITGGYVYRGSQLRCWTGRYLFGDFVRNRLWSISRDGEVLGDLREHTEEVPPSVIDGLVSFGEDGHGELYIVSLGVERGLGAVYRIDPKPQ